MNYTELSSKIFTHLKTLPGQSPTFMKHLLAYSTVLEKMHPQEFSLKMKELKVAEAMDQMKQVASEMVKQADSFHLNPSTRTIEVSLGEDTISSPIVDVREYITKDLNIEKDSQDYYLVLSYLSRIENFELFQITQALILK